MSRCNRWRSSKGPDGDDSCLARSRVPDTPGESIQSRVRRMGFAKATAARSGPPQSQAPSPGGETPPRRSRLDLGSETGALHLVRTLRAVGAPSKRLWDAPVALKCSIRRRSWVKMTNTSSTLNVAVGTAKKSRAIVPLAWFSRKVRQALRRPAVALDHVFGDRRLRDLDPEFEQLTMNSRRAPERVRPAHPSNEVNDLRIDCRASTCPAFPAPVVPKSLSMSAHHGLRLDDV